MDREQAATQFEIQAARLHFTIKQRLRNYRYVLLDEKHGKQQVTAIVLVSSFDFYTYHLHRSKKPLDVLIAVEHNAIVPTRVVSMTESREYKAGTPPANSERTNKQRRNQREKQLFISSLLIGSKSAQAELEQMHIRTRQRYQRAAESYLKPRMGRPWSS